MQQTQLDGLKRQEKLELVHALIPTKHSIGTIIAMVKQIEEGLFMAKKPDQILAPQPKPPCARCQSIVNILRSSQP